MAYDVVVNDAGAGVAMLTSSLWGYLITLYGSICDGGGRREHRGGQHRAGGGVGRARGRRLDRASRPVRPGESPDLAALRRARSSSAAPIACVDVGCGTGGPTRDVARSPREGEVTGIDLSTRMLELAAQAERGRRARQRDLRPRRRPGLPVRTRGVRRRHEQLRDDVLQRSRRRVHEHRRRTAPGRHARAARLADASGERVADVAARRARHRAGAARAASGRADTVLARRPRAGPQHPGVRRLRRRRARADRRTDRPRNRRVRRAWSSRRRWASSKD